MTDQPSATIRVVHTPWLLAAVLPLAAVAHSPAPPRRRRSGAQATSRTDGADASPASPPATSTSRACCRARSPPPWFIATPDTSSGTPRSSARTMGRTTCSTRAGPWRWGSTRGRRTRRSPGRLRSSLTAPSRSRRSCWRRAAARTGTATPSSTPRSSATAGSSISTTRATAAPTPGGPDRPTRGMSDEEWWVHRNHQRIGVATADHPGGPWTRRDTPLLDVGPDTSTS